MSRYPLFGLLLILAMGALACGGGQTPTAPSAPDLAAQVAVPDNHVALGVFDLVLDTNTGAAEVVWNRQAENHFNVTSVITPPKCYDCIVIVGYQYQPDIQRFLAELGFLNPTGLSGKDVRVVLTNPGGSKQLLNPDGVTTVWGSPMPFRAIGAEDTRIFGPYEWYSKQFDFHVPPGENFKSVSYIVDASFPNYVEEPLIE